MERKKIKISKENNAPVDTFGPKVTDVFLGDSPGYAEAIIRLPRTIHLRIERKEKEVGKMHVSAEEAPISAREKSEEISGESFSCDDKDLGEGGLVFHFPKIADIPEPVQLGDVQNELDSLLAEEEKRELELASRAEEYRRNKRQEIATHLHGETESTSNLIHNRAIVPPSENRSRVIYKADNKAATSDFALPQKRKEDSKDILLRSIMQRDAEENIPWVAPPVSWNKFRNKTVEKTKKSPKQTIQKTVVVKKEPPKIQKPKEERQKVSAKKEPFVFKKEKAWEAARIALAVLVVGVTVGLISSINTAPNLIKIVGKTATAGATHLAAGLKAISVSDVSAGQQELDEASQLFETAQDQITSSTNIAVRLLARLDPKDRLVAGQNLLDAGKKLSSLGNDAAQLTLLFKENNKNSLTDVLEKSLPLVKRLANELKDVDEKIKNVSPESLPDDMDADLQQLQGGVHALANLTSGYLDSYEVLMELLGAKQDRQYLFIFENNREIRPGGGFIGSFALADVSKGLVKKIKVDTIYNPDGQLKDYIVPPVPLQKITDRWYARDANWFADFRDNARKVANLFERSGGPTVDGVIAITPSVLEQLLRVTGPISMPEYKVTVTSDNVVDETQRLVTFEYDKEENNPKAFISDLLPEILNRLTVLPSERWGDVINAFSESLRRKQVLIWLRDQEAQTKVDNLGWSGAIEETDGDYLLRTEANIGGHKTDELMDQSVQYDVSVDSDGSATATLVVTRHHNGTREGRAGWNPDEDWYRKANIIYERTLVPKGSKLIESRGFTKEQDVPTPYVNNSDYRTFVQDQDLAELEKNSTKDSTGTVVSEENGKTSFGNWIVTEPGETTVTVYKYKLPFVYDLRSLVTAPFSYQLLVQQQPGHRSVHTEATIRIPEGFRFAWSGPESGVTFEGERKATFTSEISSDSVWGVVVERL